MALIRYLGLSGELGEGTTLGACPAEGSVLGVRAGQSLFIGRGAGSDVVIESNRVAREHVTLALMPGAGDRLVVTDLGSTNETTIAGEVKTTGVLSPGQEFVIAGLFRFRFEDTPAPETEAVAAAALRGSGGRAVVGVVMLVVGMLVAGFGTCSRTWFTDAERRADIGLYSYEACNDEGCRTRDLSVHWDSDFHGPDSREEERSEVYQFVAIGIGAFYWLAAGPALWALIQLARRRRPSALWAAMPLMLVSLIGAQIVLGLLPVRMEEIELVRTRFGAYLHGVGGLVALGSLVLLLPRRRRE